jgi:hypothetical protein
MSIPETAETLSPAAVVAARQRRVFHHETPFSKTSTSPIALAVERIGGYHDVMRLVACAHCGASISARASVCPKCKRNVEAPRDSPVADRSIPAPTGTPPAAVSRGTSSSEQPLPPAPTQSLSKPQHGQQQLGSYVARFVQTNSKWLSRFEQEQPPDVVGDYIFGGQAVNRGEVIIFVIPLWFNNHWTYLFFTKNGVIFGQRTLWRGLHTTFFIPYISIQRIRIIDSSSIEIRTLDGNSLQISFTVRAFKRLLPQYVDVIRSFATGVTIEILD